MRIAFYAPMKPPTSDVPSGDRTIARLLIQALKQAGNDVRLASQLRSWQRAPDPPARARHVAEAASVRDTLLHAYQEVDAWRPDLWFTYHVYYKAPDDLGPAVSRALRIPYVIAEASYARKRDCGAWADMQRDALAAM